MTKLTADSVKDLMKDFGADLVGIASVDRFDGAPPGHGPIDLMPQAKSVIVGGVRIPDPVVDYDEYPGGDFSHFLGGLVGTNSSEIYSCYAEGSVTGGNNSMGLGGLVGLSDNSNIINSYAATSVSGGDISSYLGGLVGTKWSGSSIENCYAIGNVSGGDGSLKLGGLVGENRSEWPRPIGETISHSFWDIETSDQTTSDGGIGLTYY